MAIVKHPGAAVQRVAIHASYRLLLAESTAPLPYFFDKCLQRTRSSNC